MTLFGKPLGEYVRFQAPVLAALVVVGVARLGASLAGLPDQTVRWLAMNLVLWAGTFYAGIAAARRGFNYRQLLPPIALSVLVFQAIAVIGILLHLAGKPNIFSAPEYSFQAESQWSHLLAHLTIGIAVPILMLWGVASLAMLITRKVARSSGTAVSARDASR